MLCNFQPRTIADGDESCCCNLLPPEVLLDQNTAFKDKDSDVMTKESVMTLPVIGFCTRFRHSPVQPETLLMPSLVPIGLHG